MLVFAMISSYLPGDNNDIPSNDQWIHHVLVKDGDQLTYYRDGVERISRTIEDEMLSPDPLPFGMGGQNGLETWRGYLSDVRLYDHALTPEEIAELVGGSTLLGDYNANGSLDAADLDLQAVAIDEGQNPAAYDLNNDDLVNYDDRLVWVEQLKNTYIGDANLDGEFNSADFVQVFVAGLYETQQAATWEQGDWDGNRLFDSSDFVAAFVGGGYELGPRAARVGRGSRTVKPIADVAGSDRPCHGVPPSLTGDVDLPCRIANARHPQSCSARFLHSGGRTLPLCEPAAHDARGQPASRFGEPCLVGSVVVAVS